MLLGRFQKGEHIMPMKKNEPVHEYRLGRILGLVWFNENGEGRGYHNVQILRLYKEGNEWKRSMSFGRDDLPLVIKVADHCHTWIHEIWQEKGDAGEGETDGQASPADEKKAVAA